MSRGAARAWDHLDAVRPPLEGGAVFVGTQALVSPRQRMGNCTTPAKKCAQDADCERRPPLAAGKCFSGMCVEMQWCPAQAEGSSDATEVHSLEGADAFAMDGHVDGFVTVGADVPSAMTALVELLDRLPR